MITEAKREDLKRTKSVQLRDPKLKARGKHIMRALVRSAAKDSGLTQDSIRQGIKARAKRQKIAKRRNIKPGTKRWRDLVTDTVKRRNKGK